jgi:methyl-accepting chemotaxis protein
VKSLAGEVTKATNVIDGSITEAVAGSARVAEPITAMTAALEDLGDVSRQIAASAGRQITATGAVADRASDTSDAIEQASRSSDGMRRAVSNLESAAADLALGAGEIERIAASLTAGVDGFLSGLNQSRAA